MHPPITPPPAHRRSFLKWLTHGLGAIFAAVIGVPAVAYLIDARNRPAPPGDFKSVARVKDLTIGVPHQVVLHDIKQDAWTLHPNDVIGRVWLIRRDEATVDAYTTTCPHLGCSINFQPGSSPKDSFFVCPCHGGTFDLACHRVDRAGKNNPAPRGMDKLASRRAPDDPEMLQVRYQNFLQGKETAVPKT